MPLSLRAVIPSTLPLPTLPDLPRCASRFCPRPPSLWQRWWARHEGVWLARDWYCSPDCLRHGLMLQLEISMALKPRGTPAPTHLPLGLVLLSQGAITSDQLRQALEIQRSTRTGKIGEWLVKMGAISEQQVTAALAAQQGCPVFVPQELRPVPAAMQWPLPLVETYRAVPVFYSPPQSDLYVGFLQGVNHAFLYSVEQMLGCRTQPCIVPTAVFREHHGRRASAAESETIVINQRQSSLEMAQAVAN